MSAVRILVFAFSVLIFSCKTSKDNAQQSNDVLKESTADSEKEKDDQSIDYEKEILNTWKWYKTNCCFRNPQVTYADSLPYNKYLVFGDKGILLTFHNDTLKSNSKYEVRYGLMDDDDRPVVVINNRPALLYIKQDTLIMDYGYMDLQTEYYLLNK